MAVDLAVYYRDGLKRGPPAPAASFGQWLSQPKLGPGLPGARRLVDLPISSQSGNVYTLMPITAPLDPSSRAVAIMVTVPGLPARPIGAPGSTEVGLNDGDSAEVWV